MGGGSKAASIPSTTTQVADIPEWERGYVERLLGQAQTIAAQPYQQFPGPTIAGFTPDQTQAFQNIENQGSQNASYQNAAATTAGQGALKAGSIYNAGAGNINASTQYNPLAAIAPYLGAASQYNSAAAAQPWLNQSAGYSAAAANAGTPQGIQNYMSPYTNSVVQGIQDQANQNWSQNIMPGINDKFVGSGQYGSGRNAQVLGQAAGNFQTGLSANVSNALQSGYNMAGQQADQQAGILGNLANTSLTGANTAGAMQGAQVSNLLNQGTAAGTATQQQAANLQNAGTNLGNLAATQAGAQLSAGTTLSNLGAQAAETNMTQNNALQAAGQQQQQLNQSNLTQAQNDWQNQVNYPKEQTEYLNQIIRGLPAPSSYIAQTDSTPAYSVSPLLGLGGASVAGLSALTGKKEGGLIKGYAAGGLVDDEEEDPVSPLEMALSSDDDSENVANYTPPQAGENNTPQIPLDSISSSASDSRTSTPIDEKARPLDAISDKKAAVGMTPSQMQQNKLLALARGILTPVAHGDPFASLGQGIGAMQDMDLAQQKLSNEQGIEAKKLDIQQQNADSIKQWRDNGGASSNKTVAVVGPDGKTMYTTVKDAMEQHLQPIAGYNTVNATLPEKSVDMMADAVAKGAKLSDLGLGLGNNANKQAVMKRVAEKYPDLSLAQAQVQMISDKAAARTIGTTGGKIEFASESLGSMIPLARQASHDLDRSKYPSINSIENAVAQGSGDTKIVALNTYLNAVIADQAALFVRGGATTEGAREKAEKMANAALSQGQLDQYFDSVGNEIKAQRSASKNALANYTGAARTDAAPIAPTPDGGGGGSDELSKLLAEKARRQGAQ